MNEKEAFAQGARCGHIEGKGRAGQYIIGEEEMLALDAVKAQRLYSSKLIAKWAAGYRLGYKLAAEGSELPKQYK